MTPCARLLLFGGIVVLVAASYFVPLRLASIPAMSPHERDQPGAWDLWGRLVPPLEAKTLLGTEAGREQLTPAKGAILIDDSLLRLGRRTFYAETFGNEVFLTDVLGIVSGPARLSDFAKALLHLGGKGTVDLRVTLSRSVVVGGRQFSKGETIDTGLDVAKGSFLPLGMVLVKDGWRLRVGLSCAVCHATVDPRTFEPIPGAPNANLRAGTLAALAPNTAAFFAHAEVNLAALPRDPRVPGLPDAAALEDAVDATLLAWPPGSFDSTIDLHANPTQIPSSFTRNAWPYGWSGFSFAGPFHGLTSLNNNVHGFNSDASTIADASQALLGVDRETYLTLLFRRAANPRYRFDPAKEEKASAFVASIDPTPGQPAFNTVVALPGWPQGSVVAPDGLFTSSPGHRFGEELNALSAWQNSLEPPSFPAELDPAVLGRGRAVFARAGCASCHAGAEGTDHLRISADRIGTEPSRARGFAALEGTLVPPRLYAFDQKVPLPPSPRVLDVPPGEDDPEQIRLAYGWNGSLGGYKVPALMGLGWTAPYLHDGGVAVGPDPISQAGVAATLGAGVAPDPFQSLRALVDRDLREKVVSANRADAGLRSVHVTGQGHPFWVDAGAGYADEDQRALVFYLLSLPSPIPALESHPLPVR